MSVLKKLFSRKSEIEPKIVQSPKTPEQAPNVVKAQEELWFSENVVTPNSTGHPDERSSSIYSNAVTAVSNTQGSSAGPAKAIGRPLGSEGWNQSSGGLYRASNSPMDFGQPSIYGTAQSHPSSQPVSTAGLKYAE